MPGKTGEVEAELEKLAAMVVKAGGKRPRILHAHFASAGAPDVIFEQEAPNLDALESQIKKLTDDGDFQMWTKKTVEPAHRISQTRNLSRLRSCINPVFPISPNQREIGFLKS